MHFELKIIENYSILFPNSYNSLLQISLWIFLCTYLGTYNSCAKQHCALAPHIMMILIYFGKRYMENWKKSDNGPHWLPQITSQDDDLETCGESFPPSFSFPYYSLLPNDLLMCLLIMNTKQRKMTKEVISLQWPWHPPNCSFLKKKTRKQTY